MYNLNPSIWSYRRLLLTSLVLALLSVTTLIFAEGKADEPGNLKWKYETGGYVKSSPAIGPEGTVYVGSYDNYL